MRLVSIFTLSAVLALGACSQSGDSEEHATTNFETFEAPSEPLLRDLWTLSADDMDGRWASSEGSARARAYIISRYEEIGIEMIGDTYESEFEVSDRRSDDDETFTATNIIGRIRGTSDSERVMVLSAHYDHMGVRDGQTWNGADDNASGVSAMLAAATDFIANPPLHDIIVVAFDAEEWGLLGAHHFVANPPIDQANITFNLNLDMVAMDIENNLWAVGTHHYPYLKPLVETVQPLALVNLPMGYDEPSLIPGHDWTPLSDQGAFHAIGIPIIYLGVDFHPHYHEPSDIYDNMTLEFFQKASATITIFAQEADRRLDEIGDAAGR
jgi:hypothetical protein